MTNKVVVITGCSSGFGLVTALAFARQGYRVIATMRDTNKSAELIEQAQQLGCYNNIQIRALDITDSESIALFARSITAVDILVNNAGFALAGFSEDIPIAHFKSQFETNFFGTVALTHALLPVMRQQKHGRIINVSSISGRLGFPGLSAYVASKHALEGWSESLRLELANHGIWVTLVEPGSYQTNIWQQAMQETNNAAALPSVYDEYYQKIQRYVANTSHRRGDPLEVANKIVSIASQKKPGLRYPIGQGVRLMIVAKTLLNWHSWQGILLKSLKKD